MRKLAKSHCEDMYIRQGKIIIATYVNVRLPKLMPTFAYRVNLLFLLCDISTKYSTLKKSSLQSKTYASNKECENKFKFPLPFAESLLRSNLCTHIAVMD